MHTADPQLIDAVKTNTHAFMTLSQIGFSSIERLTAMNLNMARAALEEGVAATASMVQINDPKELQKLRDAAAGPTTERAVAYVREVQEIFTQTQQEITSLMSSYFSTFGKGAPASAGWTSGFDMFNKLAQQMTAMAEANIKAVGNTTAKVVPPTAPTAKESA